MGHFIQVFIAKPEIFETSPDTVDYLRIVHLNQGFVVVPNTEVFAGQKAFAHTGQLSGSDSEFAVFDQISPAQIDWAARISLAGPVAYVETEYWGGTGTQSAVVWDNGKVVLGPFTTETTGSEDVETLHLAIEQGAINRALRYLGVHLGTDLDEFEALGLGDFRNTEDF